MFKKIFSVLALSFLLVGCANENAKVNTEDTTQKEIIEEVIEKKTTQQYLAEFEKTDIYQERVKGRDSSFLVSVDFEGDEVPEMVLGINDDIKNSNVTIYKFDNDQWIEDISKNYESNIHIYLESIGKLPYEDGTLKEALAFEIIEAQASTIRQSLSILNYNETTQSIKELVEIELQSTETYSANLEENSFIVTAENGFTQNYIFKNGEIVDNSGKRLGIIINEELSKLVGTTINDYYINFTDFYYTAQSKIKENLIAEEYYEGAMCSFYETFFLCESHKENGGMHAYYITPKNKVTVDELTSIFNQTVEVVGWENEMEGGYSYTAEVMTDSGLYSLEFDGDTPDSVLEFIAYVPN